MKTYEHFANRLDQLLGNNQCARIHADGFMPLVVEDITCGGTRHIALSHTTTQNGDLMRDPEMVFEIIDACGVRFAEPVSFRDDSSGLLQEVYRYDSTGRKTHVLPQLKTELRTFARTWFRNLKSQGFFAKSAKREVLA